MTKQDIHEQFIQKLTNELDTISCAARSSIATATSDAHHAEGKYDTFSLETSYLARGQARRVAELRQTLERLHLMPLKTLRAADPVQLSALVRLQSPDGETRVLYIGTGGGGECIEVEGEETVLVTPQSPLGRAVLGKTTGDTVSINLAGNHETFTVLLVE